MAAAVALTQATGPVHLVTDSTYVRDGIIALGRGHEPQAEATNLDKWWHIEQHVHKVCRVSWIKGHRTEEQARELGFAEEDRRGNAAADDLATLGLAAHTEADADVLTYANQRAILREIHKHILKQQTWYTDHKILTFGEEGEYFERVSREKRKRYEHKVPLLERELKKIRRSESHNIQNFGKYDACLQCGRRTQADNGKRTKQHQWAPFCTPLPTFRPFLEKNHELTLVDGEWQCLRCQRTGKWLASRCEDLPNPEGHVIIHYQHADACHICGRYTLHTSRPIQAKKVWGAACQPAARFLTYSPTHELELHGRSWRCRWCHRSGKELIQQCTGDPPQVHAKFVFRGLTKKAIKKARGRRFWGRKRGSRQGGAQARRPGMHSSDHRALQGAWAGYPPPDALAPRVTTVQGEAHTHLLRRPPERGGGH